jgi:hypothetical protein
VTVDVDENCTNCVFWRLGKRIEYADGTVILIREVPEPQGKCGILEIATDPLFGCKRFLAIASWDQHLERESKPGAPWQHSVAGPCPDCAGTGSPPGGLGCYRCAGTGKVRHYDDGHIGEERTRLHPVEAIIRRFGMGGMSRAEAEAALAPLTGNSAYALRIAAGTAPEPEGPPPGTILARSPRQDEIAEVPL